MAESLKQKTARGLFWGGTMNALQQVLNLAFGICLGRLLTDSDYGMVGMLTIFSAVAGALQEGGFISALNKRKDVTDADYNSVFWFNTLVSAGLYAVLFFCAPLIARFYGEPELVPLARFLFLGFFITALNIVPRARMFREMRVKANMLIILAAQVVSGAVGIVLAWNGFAYWGIATQTVVYVSTITLLCYATTRWRPSFRFTFQPVREMFGFSSRLIVTSLANILNQNLLSVLLGRFYTRAEVGNFTQANKWNYMGHSTLTNMLWGVAQPVLTKVDEDPARQQAVFRKLLRFAAFVSFPAMFGLCLVSREFIYITITPKWEPAVPMLQLLCLWGAFVPVQSLFCNLLISRGRSDWYMWGTLALVGAELAGVLAVNSLGVAMILRVFVATNIAWLFVWHALVQRETGLRLRHVLLDLAPYFFLAAALCLAAAYLSSYLSGLWLKLVFKVVFVGALYIIILYMSGSVILRESMQFLGKKKEEG